MPTETRHIHVPPRRARRVIGYGGTGVAAASAGYRGPREDEDQVVADIEGAMQAAPAIDTAPPPAPGSPEFTPSERLRQVRGTAYERQYRLQLIHRMLLRRIPADQIAAQCQISLSQVYKDIAELKTALRKAAQGLNVDEMIGDTMGYFNEIAAMSLRIASNDKIPTQHKLAALRTAMASRNDLNRFFQASGVFDELRYQQQHSKQDKTDIELLTELVRTMAETVATDGDLPSLDQGLTLDEDNDLMPEIELSVV